jgi:alcohol dehydrogenase (cytochrome c)
MESTVRRTSFVVAAIILGVVSTGGIAQVKNLAPVTTEMLLNPSADDWLMFSRTYDGQRFSPLKEITRQNVGGLRLVWKQEMTEGTHEGIPLVYGGVMYVIQPGGVIRAVDGATGKPVWEYRRDLPTGALRSTSKAKNLAIYDDLIFYTTPDNYLMALEARTGHVRWEVRTANGNQDTSGPLVVEGKVITGRACGRRDDCFISAHDAKTGKEVWKFYTVPAPGEPGADTWGGADVATMRASPWGLAGSYDPVRRLIFWGVANPTPFTRLERRGTPDLTNDHTPSDLYSNSTLALNPDTGKLVWYYQHLPGDDWDEDYNEDKILLRTPLNPDPKFLKWINPDLPRGEQRDILVTVGEGGGIWALDRATGQFLWATPFPYDTPNFLISKIDGRTGRSYINTDLVMKHPGDHHIICYWNTRNYWPLAYHPGLNALYVPFADNCLDMTAAAPGKPQIRVGVPRATNQRGIRSDPNAFAGIMKINMSTGEFTRIYTAAAPGNGASLVTAGDLLFWGDLEQKFRAFDAESGRILWETTLDGPIQNSTITYAVNGKQYVSVLTGEGGVTTGWLIEQLGLKTKRRDNAIYTFALP